MRASGKEKGEKMIRAFHLKISHITTPKDQTSEASENRRSSKAAITKRESCKVMGTQEGRRRKEEM
jgi:hypothetical protein